MSTLIKPGGSTGPHQTGRGRAPGKAWKKGVAGGAVVAVLAGSALASAVPAMAAGESITASVTTSPPNGYYTGQMMNDGTIGYCDTDPQAPVAGTADYSTPHAVAGSFTSLGGNTWSGTGLRDAAYILAKYGQTTDLTQSVAVHRAQTQLENAGGFDPGSPGGASQALADTYIADAAANAAAVEAGYSANLVIPGQGPTGTVTITGPAGYGGTATINGPAVWANTNSSGTQFTTGQPLPQIVVTGNGAIKVTGTVDGLPDTTLWVSESPTSQDLFKAGHTHSAAFDTGDVQAAVAFQPVATSTAPVYLEAGQKLTDVLHVTTSTGNANDWVVANGANVPALFDDTWYYSPTKLDPSAGVPVAAVKYTTGTATANGPGDITVTGAKLTDKPGFYYPVASFAKANQPAEQQGHFTGDWSAGFNDPGEQSIVKYAPQVSTKASEIDADGMIHDIITVTGNEPGKELNVVTDLTLTSAAPIKGGVDEAPTDAKTIGTVTTKITGNGEFTSPGVKVPWELVEAKQDKEPAKPANLYFSEKIAATPTTKAWDGKELLPDETVSVGVPKVTTKASVIENGKVHDVIEVTGNVPGKELTVSSDLFLTSAAPVKGGADKAPADAKLIGAVKTKVTGNGTFNTPSIDVPWEQIMNEKWAKGADANLYWSEKIAPSSTTKAWDGKELLPNETVPVEKPAVTTQASENGTVPVNVTDKATVTGTIPTGDGVSTSLWWKLYKFGDDTTDSVQAVCQTDFWASKAAVDVTKAGDYTSEETTLTDKGTYGYIETLVTKYTDREGNIKTVVLHQGKCGEKEETVVAFPQDTPPSPEKPQLQVPDQPAPVAYTGEVTAQQGINTPLLFGGAAVLVAMLAIGGGVYVQRRKAAAMNAAADSANTDDI